MKPGVLGKLSKAVERDGYVRNDADMDFDEDFSGDFTPEELEDFLSADSLDVKADPSLLSRSSNRGLVLIHMFMDEIAFNPAGNEITMVKYAR